MQKIGPKLSNNYDQFVLTWNYFMLKKIIYQSLQMFTWETNPMHASYICRRLGDVIPRWCDGALKKIKRRKDWVDVVKGGYFFTVSHIPDCSQAWVGVEVFSVLLFNQYKKEGIVEERGAQRETVRKERFFFLETTLKLLQIKRAFKGLRLSMVSKKEISMLKNRLVSV